MLIYQEVWNLLLYISFEVHGYSCHKLVLCQLIKELRKV